MRLALAFDAIIKVMRSWKLNLACVFAVTSSAIVFAGAQDSGAGGTSAPKAPKKSEPQPATPMPTDQALTLSPEASEGNWQLDFQPGDFRLYTDPETHQNYWYFTYKVVNRTGQDRWWAPKMELLEDHGGLRRSGKDVSPITVKRIEALIGNKLIEDQFQIIGEIRQGESNAKEGFVVWSSDALLAKELHLFIRGMSSEFKKMPNPAEGGAEITMHKTMKRDYRVSGDPQARGSTPLECEQTEWILR